MIVPITKAPNDVLSAIAKPIETIDDKIKVIIQNMKDTLASTKDPEGVGLAAPQIGKSIQLFIIRQNPKDEFQVYINPVVTFQQRSKKIQYKSKNAKGSGKKLEGCLSLDTIWGEVKRHNKIHIAYTNEKGERIEENVVGFLSIIIQHEYDHLQGILFPRRVLEQKGSLYKSGKDKNGKEVFEPLEI